MFKIINNFFNFNSLNYINIFSKINKKNTIKFIYSKLIINYFLKKKNNILLVNISIYYIIIIIVMVLLFCLN